MATEALDAEEAVLVELRRIGNILEQQQSAVPLRDRFAVSDAEAAHLLGCSRSHFRDMVRRGLMPKARKGGARSIWMVEEILAALCALPQEK